MALPITVPQRIIGSLGPNKKDLNPPPNFVLYLGAKEINLAFDLIIRLCEEVNALGIAGATGSLQAAYNNSGAGPVVIQLDGTRKQIIVRDTSAGLGQPLIGVQNNIASVYYGLTVDGLLLPNTAKALYTDSGTSVRMQSGQLSPSPAYVLSAVSPYKFASDIFLSMTEDTDIYGIFTGDRSFFFFAPGLVSTIKWGLSSATAGAVRLYTDEPAGLHFLPASDGDGALGGPADRWAGVYAGFYAGTKQSIAWVANLTIDCSLGNVVEIPVDSAITDFTFINAQDGVTMTLVFLQNPTGTGYLAGPLPAGYALLDSEHLGLTMAANAVDVSVWQYVNTATTKWVEVARSRQLPSIRRVEETTLTSGTITLKPSQSPRMQVFEGALTGDQVIDLDNSAWAKQGDEFEIAFTDAVGVTTDPAKKLSITTDAGATVLREFNLAATLHGVIRAYHTGTAWKLIVGNSLVYL